MDEMEPPQLLTLLEKKVVDVTGIEPATPCLQRMRLLSNGSEDNLNYQHLQQIGEPASAQKLTPMHLKNFHSCTLRAQPDRQKISGVNPH